jgi:predicted dehydrogenase
MLNLAVIGCGYWGPNLVRNFNSLSDCNVVAVCDACGDRLTHMKKLYPHLSMITDADEIFADESIDAVAIATPVNFHYKLAMKSLGAGKHTFIEKPMASSVDECRELLDLAHNMGLTLMVGHTFIYSPPVKKIKELVDSGDLGGIQYVSSRRLNLGLFQKDINVTWDLAPHDIAIILHVLNDKPVSVNCQGKAHVSKGVEDVCNMTINFANGGFCTIQSSWLDPNKIREMTFVGEKRMLVYNDLEPIEKIKIYDKRVEKPPHYDTFAEFHYSYHYGDMYSPYLKQFEPLKEECQHFIDCIKTKCESISSGREGLKVVQILTAASESLKQRGAAVSIGDLG